MNREKKIIQTSLIGIAANILLVVAKAIIGFIAHSIALITDAIIQDGHAVLPAGALAVPSVQ